MGAACDSPHLHLSPLTASLLNCTTSLLSCVACDAFPVAGTAGKAALAPSLAEVGMRRPWQHPHTCLLSPAHATTSAARGANRTRNTECSSLQQVWGCLSTAMGHRELLHVPHLLTSDMSEIAPAAIEAGRVGCSALQRW